MLICVLGFPVNFSGGWILPNIKHWKLSTTQVVDEGKIDSWGGAQTKGEVHKCELTETMFFQSDFLQLRLNKKRNITEFFPDTTVLIIKKIGYELMRKKR